MKISATIVAFNEEHNIERAIASLRLGECADEILLVDSGSTDRTREIAAGLGARVIEEPWRGYAAQKNFAATCAAFDWILSIDADEELTPGLAAEIAALKTKNQSQFGGWTMPRLARYLGRWIRHGGWYPDRKVRLYHRERAAWHGDYVHESVQVSGPVGHLENNLLHFTCDSLGQHLRTLDRYTTLAAQSVAASGKPVPFRRLVVDPPWTFVRSYILQRGFLDGGHGFVIAGLASFYTFMKYAKARELPKEPKL